jgi:cell division protein FtsL
MKKPVLILLVLFLTIGILFGVRSVASSRITTSGLELGDIQDQTRAYKTQNTILREKIFTLSSLNHVSETASKVGFVESKETFAVSGQRPIARGQ